tara:strand:+ start:143 stop:736 length:594 start_codon:yes stop_codon:yes gene_type:complete
MPFFSDSGPGGFQPKRQFRFLVSFTEMSNLTFMVTKTKKPSYTMTEKTHQVLNHQFNFPGVVKWEPVNVNFIDAVDPNIGSKFYNSLRNAGYVSPITESALLTGVTKVSTTAVVGNVVIQQLDGGGVLLPAGQDPGEVIGAVDATNIVDQWTLKNAFIKGVKFGENLGYDQDGLVEVSVDLVYDYAEYGDNLGAYGS